MKTANEMPLWILRDHDSRVRDVLPHTPPFYGRPPHYWLRAGRGSLPSPPPRGSAERMEGTNKPQCKQPPLHTT